MNRLPSASASLTFISGVRADSIFAAMHGLTGRELEGKTIYDVMGGEILKRVETV